MVSRVLAQRDDMAQSRSVVRQQMQVLPGAADVGLQAADRVSTRIQAALPAVENTQQLDIALIETFTHPGNHGQIDVYAVENQTIELLRRIEADALDYKQALTRFAGDEKTLSDNVRAGKDPAGFAEPWLNEDPAGPYEGRNSVFASLNQQRDWLRIEWSRRRSEYEALRLALGNLRTRASIGSLMRLVVVLGFFLGLGVAVPLGYLSARGGASREWLLAAFCVLALWFWLYLANEVRRLSRALHLEIEVW